MCAINLPKVALGTVAAGIRTHDLLITSMTVVVNRLLNFQYWLTSPFEKVYRRNEFMNSLARSYIAWPILTKFDMRAYNVEGKICREMTAALIHRAPAWSYTARCYAQGRSLLSSTRPVSVCLSVSLSCWCIVSRRLKISSNFLFGPVAPSL